MNFLHEYQLAIGQILENDPLIHTTFFYDVRFTKNDEIKIHCNKCFCYTNCCCSTSSPKVNSNYNNELEKLTSDYEECFFKVKLDQIFDTQAYKILNKDSISINQPLESDAYQPFRLVTAPIYQPLISDAPAYPKMHVYAPVAKYPNEEYYQMIQNQNREYEQLCLNQQKNQQPSQNTTLEQRFFNPASSEYQQSRQPPSDQLHQEVLQHPDYQQSIQIAKNAFKPFNQQHTLANQLNQTSSIYDQKVLPTVPDQQQQNQNSSDQHQMYFIEQPSQVPVNHEYRQNFTQQPLKHNITAMITDQTHSPKKTLANLGAKQHNELQAVQIHTRYNKNNERNQKQASMYHIALALHLNKKRQRTIEMQEISPPQKYSKLSIFHSISTMSR